MRARRVLVIGGAGFIGSRLVSILTTQGADVRVLDKSSGSGLANEGAHRLVGDVRSFSDVRGAMRDVDLVYNLAAEHQDNVRPRSLYDEVNVEGARVVCEAAVDAEVMQIIFTSSVAVYGDHSQPMDEGTEHRYFNDYGRTKHLAEEVYRRWQEGDPSRRLTIVRPTVVFGPGNRGNVYNLLRQIKHGPWIMFGDGSNIKSLAHVENVASFLSFIAAQESPFSLYNYADKPDLTVRELVEHVRRSLGIAASRSGVALPLHIASVLGVCADAVSALIRRPLPVSAVRVRKFAAPSQVDAQKAFDQGFVAPVDIRVGLSAMVRDHV